MVRSTNTQPIQESRPWKVATSLALSLRKLCRSVSSSFRTAASSRVALFHNIPKHRQRLQHHATPHASISFGMSLHALTSSHSASFSSPSSLAGSVMARSGAQALPWVTSCPQAIALLAQTERQCWQKTIKALALRYVAWCAGRAKKLLLRPAFMYGLHVANFGKAELQPCLLKAGC